MLLEPHQLALEYYPAPILRVNAKPIESVDDSIRALVDRMLELMAEHEGIGLAAPQVGLPLRMFVANVPPDPDNPLPHQSSSSHDSESIASATNGPEVYINPVIEFIEREVSPFNEGCLSLPDIRGDVLRPDVVRIAALDRHGKPFERIGAGLLARCWQHETDHLNGVLIIDKMKPGDLRNNKRRIRELERAH